jgi:hypothetical protein
MSLSLSNLDASTDDDEESDGWSSILGVGWCSASSLSTQATEVSNPASSTSNDSVPDLLPMHQHNGSESDSDNLIGDNEFSKGDSVEESYVEELDVEGFDKSGNQHTAPKLCTWIQQKIQSLYEQRYEEPLWG